MIFAIATKCSVYLYDTQQQLPFGLISNIHYTRLTDLAWSNDGNTLLVSSTDGFCSIVQFAEGELGEIYKEQTIENILATKTAKDEPKKKKKVKKAGGGKKEDEKEKSSTVDDMLVDLESPLSEISLNNLPESIKEKIPVDKIIKSSEIFSPEKRDGSPATPIQVRKFPRTLEEAPMVDNEKMVTPPKDDDDLEPSDVTTPKATNVHHITSKTPTPIEVRRHPRSIQPQPASKINEVDDWPMPIMDSSPMNRKLPAVDGEKITPKTPRRIELRTISTPKSKKKLM